MINCDKGDVREEVKSSGKWRVVKFQMRLGYGIRYAVRSKWVHYSVSTVPLLHCSSVRNFADLF